MNKITFLYFVFYIQLIYQLNYVASVCDVPLKIYRNLNCTAVYEKKGMTQCPVRFDCSNIHNDRTVVKKRWHCYFNGDWYGIGDVIEVSEMCGFSTCTCTKSLNFECTKRPCPKMNLPKSCYLGYELDDCCAKKVNCFTQWKSLTTCNVNNKFYLEGELFPSVWDKCDLCVCNRNFDGNYGSHSCCSIPCKFGLLKSAELMRFCAPVYLYNDDCCPVDVKCPSESERGVLRRFKFRGDRHYCMYENYKMEIGQVVSHSLEHYGSFTYTECKCLIPPYVTCYREYNVAWFSDY